MPRRLKLGDFKKSPSSDVMVPKAYEAKIEDGGTDRVIQFTISTSAVDRHNDTVNPDGWDLSHFNKNGPVLWAHECDSPPLGKALATWVEDGKLKSRAKFMPREISEFAEAIYQMLKEGYLKATSVGFIPLEYKFNEERGSYALDFMRQELIEYSVVPIPANPEALSDAEKSIDLSCLKSWTTKALDEGHDLIVPREDLEKANKILHGHKSVVAVPKADEPKADEPKADEPKADEPKADEPKADEPKADETKADEPEQKSLEDYLSDLEDSDELTEDQIALCKRFASLVPQPTNEVIDVEDVDRFKAYLKESVRRCLTTPAGETL